MKTKSLWLPALFWEDHGDRGLPSGRLLRRAKNRVKILATANTLKEILSDAAYYSDAAGPDCIWPALKRSAKRTAEIVRAALAE